MTITNETNPSGQDLHWAKPQDITWSLATSNLPGQLAQFSSFMPTTPYAEIVNQAFAAWQGADPALHFIYSPDSPSVDIRVGFENLNTPSTTKIGDTRYHYTGSTFDKAIIGVEDPRFDPLSLQISASSTWGKNGTSWLLQTLEHEIGHALGLDHDTDIHSIMYPSTGTADRSLSPNDILAIRKLYPLTTPSAPTPTPTPITGTSPTGVRAAMDQIMPWDHFG